MEDRLFENIKSSCNFVDSGSPALAEPMITCVRPGAAANSASFAATSSVHCPSHRDSFLALKATGCDVFTFISFSFQGRHKMCYRRFLFCIRRRAYCGKIQIVVLSRCNWTQIALRSK